MTRLGKFRIAYEYWRDDHADFMKVLNILEFKQTKAREYLTDGYVPGYMYTGSSDKFMELDDGEETPEYMIICRHTCGELDGVSVVRLGENGQPVSR
ncbi:MAG: hypothetical protein ACWGQW_25365 [bacterium]